MSASHSLFRSVLYIPASRQRALDKAAELDCDAIIFDLEDAVAPEEKEAARATLGATLSTNDYGERYKLLRINGMDSFWGQADIAEVANMNCDAVLLPKVEGTEVLDAVAGTLSGLPIWCMMETPRGILNALSIADHPAVEGFVMGTNDLAKEIGCETGGDRLPMMASLQNCLLAARAAGIFCVDGVYNSFRDDEGLEAECMQGLALGMDGKTLIHPAQLNLANKVFAPDDAQIHLARRQIEAFETAQANGEGVAVVDGKIVENLHIETARRILKKAEVIRSRAAA